jgi:ParB-like nuclease domain
MTKKTKLQKSRDITAAAKAIPGLTCRLVVPGTGKTLYNKTDITTAGIPRTIEMIDHAMGIQRQILDIGHKFAQVLADHPEAPGLVPQDFAHGSIERELLTYIEAVIVGDDDAEAQPGTLFNVVEDALPRLFDTEPQAPHLTKAEALRLLANAQSNIELLGDIRDLLTDEPVVVVTPRSVDKPRGRLLKCDLDEIIVGDRLRKTINHDVVHELMASIQNLGLRQPPTVRIEVDEEGCEDVILVAGLHRIEACKRLGVKVIDCVEFKGSETEARKWEIAENLHRAELTVQERAEHIAEWVRLVASPNGQNVHSELQRGAVAKAVRELPLHGGTEDAKRKEIERAVKIAAIAPEAKAAAAAAGLNNSQTALLTVAQAAPEQQARVVEELAARKAYPVPDVDPAEREFNRLLRAWVAASDPARERFMVHVRRSDGW